MTVSKKMRKNKKEKYNIYITNNKQKTKEKILLDMPVSTTHTHTSELSSNK